MEIRNCREQILDMIEGHISGRISAQETPDRALKLIVSKDSAVFPLDAGNAFNTLFDLHNDNVRGASWVPRPSELTKRKVELEKRP